MVKPIKEMIFREIEGVWKCVSGESEILADVLLNLELIIDDKCQFARFYDYERNICTWYRHWGGKITLTLWKIDPI